jgi:Tfp pilus assembly PilM family ATPase
MTVSPKKKKPVYAGLSITHRAIELAIFSPRTMAIEQSVSVPLPPGLFDDERDIVQDPGMFKELLAQALRAVKPKPVMLHLSLPSTLLRMVEMPRMDAAGLYVSLSSEAERYRTFDNTEASVDFVMMNNPGLPPNILQLVLGAVRSDAMALYFRIFKELKIKPVSISLEPLNILRGMAATGVLDGLVQQIGMDSRWGMIFVEPARVRFSLWQCDHLLEFRELAMDTSEFDQASEGALVVEDMLEEMRRTTKNEQPVLWLTHNMPSAMERTLSNVLGCPVRSAPIGESIALTAPLQLSTIGCAMASVVQYPFDLDILEGAKSAGVSPSGGDVDLVESGDSSVPGWLIPAGIVSLLLGGVATGIVYVMTAMAADQVPKAQAKVDTIKVEVSGLTSRQQELKKKAELDQTLMDMVMKSKVRNHVYVAFTDDLKEKTPQQVWIQNLKVSDKLEMIGKALNHESVITFAKSFDSAPYSKAVLIDSIKEGKLGASIIYDFKISGGVNLDKSLLNQTDGLQPANEPSAKKANASGA